MTNTLATGAPAFLWTEADYLARRTRRPDPAGVLAEVAASLVIDGPLLRAGYAIVDALEVWSRAHGELPYHNRHHAGEAALAMAGLCSIAMNRGWLNARQAQAGVVAMLGHDLGHDGRPGGDGVLEVCSGRSVFGLAIAAGVDVATAELLRDVIHATNPALAAENAACAERLSSAGSDEHGRALLLQLANEADIAASLLPRLGPRLGRALAREWQGRPNAMAGIGSHAGQLAFLRSVPRLSRPAMTLGLEAAREASLAVYAAVGAAQRGVATAAEGCAALDGLDRATARAAYVAALRALV